MTTNTSIGPDGNRGGNDNPGNADGCGNKTLGSAATGQPASGAEAIDKAFPDGPNVAPSPSELDAARGQPAKGR